jgi:cellulose synthase/poly-beta-1,6-N-acetylglucosamine synthase-like glycosyltransferase
MLDLSLGIMAHNEADNIGRLLERVSGERLTRGRLGEIIVVASGCTDDTEAIVRRQAGLDPRITLLTQEEREGKASAVNLFLARATGDVLLLESADTLPEPGAFDLLAAAFDDPGVGMAGARPVPVDRADTFTGHATRLLWALHHAIALETPKLGELVAFRRQVKEIPADTAVDEASIEAAVRAAGLELRYVPAAVVRNKGPETGADLLRQRRRIAAGHLHLRRTRGHRVSTTGLWRSLRALAGLDLRPRRPHWTTLAMLLEGWARLLGAWDLLVRGRNPVAWEMARTTKRLD